MENSGPLRTFNQSLFAPELLFISKYPSLSLLEWLLSSPEPLLCFFEWLLSLPERVLCSSEWLPNSTEPLLSPSELPLCSTQWLSSPLLSEFPSSVRNQQGSYWMELFADGVQPHVIFLPTCRSYGAVFLNLAAYWFNLHRRSFLSEFPSSVRNQQGSYWMDLFADGVHANNDLLPTCRSYGAGFLNLAAYWLNLHRRSFLSEFPSSVRNQQGSYWMDLFADGVQPHVIFLPTCRSFGAGLLANNVINGVAVSCPYCVLTVKYNHLYRKKFRCI